MVKILKLAVTSRDGVLTPGPHVRLREARKMRIEIKAVGFDLGL